MLTVIKFFTNHDRGSNNRLISRTLLKISVINKTWKPEPGTLVVRGKEYSLAETEPQDEEFWLVRLVNETNTGAQGAFLVHPLFKVPGIDYLLPNQLHLERYSDECLIVNIDNSLSGEFFILPARLKRSLAGTNSAAAKVYASIIVNHGVEPGWGFMETRKEGNTNVL